MIAATRSTKAFHLRTASRNKGFTLTEIAIVLGIIGMILGAIWVAASSVYNNQRIARATNELLTITQGIRSLYATSSTVDTTGNADMDLTAGDAGKYTYIQANIFPSDMVAQDSKSVSDPWGGPAAVASATVVTAGDAFTVTFDQVSQGGCIAMLTANTGTGRDNALQAAGGGAAGALPTLTAANNTSFPIAASAAQAMCTAAKNAVAFEFRLKG